MKGLLIKDYLLLKKQLKTCLMFIFVAFFTAYSGHNLSISFLFLAFFSVSIANQTLFYDQEKHGIEYILSLPISKKTYILEKQLLSLLMSLISLLIASVGSILFQMVIPVQFNGILFIICISLVVATFYSSLMIPFCIRYGTEKARILIMGFVLLIMAIGFFFIKSGNSVDSFEILNRILSLQSPIIILLTGLVEVVLIGVSYFLSQKAFRNYYK